MVTSFPNLKMFLSVEITLEATTQNNFSKSRKFAREISAAEFPYSCAIVFAFHYNLTYVYETYDFMEVYYDL